MRKTEMRNPASMHIDTMCTADMIKVMQNENLNAVKAVEAANGSIAKAVDAISERMKKGGRLFYVGCGTSGRLGVLDAAECPPTFGVPEGLVIGIIAGGDEALKRSKGLAEDSAELGMNDLKQYEPTNLDSVMGISAAGGAAYVLGAVEYAKSVGALTVGTSSTEDSLLLAAVDIPIFTDTGAEVVSGSTRMKAGTAQKLVLNMISTGIMIKLGCVYENLMINLRPLNAKLVKRMNFIVSELTGLDEAGAAKLLEENGQNIRRAVDTYKNRIDRL